MAAISLVNALELKDHVNKQAKTLSAGLKRKVRGGRRAAGLRGRGAAGPRGRRSTVVSAWPRLTTSCALVCFQLCFALSMIGNPQIVLLDEPSSGMDPKSKQRMW